MIRSFEASNEQEPVSIPRHIFPQIARVANTGIRNANVCKIHRFIAITSQ